MTHSRRTLLRKAHLLGYEVSGNAPYVPPVEPDPDPDPPPPATGVRANYLPTAAIENEAPASGRPYSEADLIAIATKFDLVSTQVAGGGWTGTRSMFSAAEIDLMREVNPNFRPFVYVNGGATHNQNLPENHYAHNAQGQRLENTRWGTIVLDPSSVAGRQALVDLARARFDHNPKYAGIFIDVLGDYNRTQQGGAINPATGNVYTRQEWYDQTRITGAAMQGGLPADKVAIGNGIQGGGTWPVSKTLVTYTTTDPTLRPLRFAMPESIGHTGNLAAWEKNRTMMEEANALGVSFYIAVKAWGATTAVADQKLLFGWASVALFNEGRFSVALSRSQALSLKGEDFATRTYGPPLGAATQNAAGVWFRSFEQATIVVNPTTTSWTGMVSGVSTTVPPWQARIVLK